jgi:hypothetical protein
VAGNGHPRQMTISRETLEKQNSAYGSTSDGPPEILRGAVGFGGDSRLPFLARPSLGMNMLLRTARLGALAATAILLPAWVVAPLTTKYRIDQSLTQEIDATAAGGAKQKIAFSTSSFVTVTLADSAGGKAIRVVVDSMRGDSATPIPPAVLDSARGAEFRGFVQKSGKLTGLEPVGGAKAAAQVQGLLSDFFPWTKPSLKVGESWSDTTAKTNGSGSDSVTVRRVSAYKAAANETHDSRKAVRVTEDFTSSVAGTQPTPNGPARIEGTGSGSGAYYVGNDGRYLGGSWQQQSSLKVSGSFAPQPLPITIVQKIKVSTLK